MVAMVMTRYTDKDTAISSTVDPATTTFREKEIQVSGILGMMKFTADWVTIPPLEDTPRIVSLGMVATMCSMVRVGKTTLMAGKEMIRSMVWTEKTLYTEGTETTSSKAGLKTIFFFVRT
jgi:hypothetical protein